MKRTFALVILIILGASAGMFSQTSFRGMVRGRVMDLSTGKPFVNVTIALYSMPDSTLKTGAATDNEGDFSLPGIAEGSYLLVMSFVGYTTETFPFVITADVPETDLGEFLLSEATGDAGDVTVVAVRPQVIYRQDKKIVMVDDFRKAGATTLAQVLENIPSVTVDAEGNVLLRGSSDYTLLIDGNPAPPTGTNMLRQIPAEMVESVEVMTNPSARYDPDGTAGIINLILKKQKQPGFNGMISGMAGLGGKYSGDIQANYRKGRVNLFGGVTGMLYNVEASGDILRENDLSGGELLIDSRLTQEARIRTLNFNTGADVTLNERNSMTISGLFGPIIQEVGVTTSILTDNSETSSREYSLYKNDIGLDAFFFNPSLRYTHNFGREGEKIVFNLFGGGLRGDITQEMTDQPASDQWIPLPGDPVMRESVLSLDIMDFRFKSDYERAVGEKSKLEAGFQYILLDEDNRNDFNNYDPVEGAWVPDTYYSNEFSFDRDVLSLYGTWSSAVGKYSYQLGLRGEYTNRRIEQITLDEHYDYERLSMFPTAHVTRDLGSGSQLQLSYSRRINRPGRNVLNPFPQFIDDNTIVSGNPQIRPEFTGSWELSYQKPVKTGLVSTEVFYRQTNDIIESLIEIDGEGKTFMTPGNSDRSHSAGGEFMANLQPVSWLRFIGSGSVYYYLLDDESLSAEAEESTVSWDLNSNAIFLLSPSTRISLSGIYTGPSINVQGRTNGAFMLNAGFNQGFMKQKLTLSLGVRDLLATYRLKTLSSGENFRFTSSIKPEQRIVTLTLTYNFNNFQRRLDQQESMEMNLLR
ncbi:MAG: outer membrane beta-barrel family protein [Bacteroidales bacterium]|jgi:outer membrane receptor protein involved in Fe transport|nr:outer membrane beta-barrel family protein [Bacteroidales bacterium]